MSFERLKVDNPSNLYPTLIRGRHGYNFRVCAVLCNDVKPEVLKEAAVSLSSRFPVLYSHLIKATFGYYHVPALLPPDIEENAAPMQYLPPVFDTDKPSFCLFYSGNKITMDVFHANADGSAAATYMRALVTRYFELEGITPSLCDGVLRAKDAPIDEELEDSYKKLYKRGKRISRQESNAFDLRTDKVEGLHRQICVKMNSEQVRVYTKPHGITVTELLLALIYDAAVKLYDVQKDTLPIKLSVPIDVRNIFPSKTLRNYALYTNLELYPSKPMSFEESITEISRQLKAGLDKDRLIALASSNVRLERNIFIRAVPRVIRDHFIRKGFRVFGARKISTTLSNIGLQRLPPELDGLVDRFEMYLGSGGGGMNFAAAGYNGGISLCISLSGHSNTVIDTITARLTELGIEYDITETDLV